MSAVRVWYLKTKARLWERRTSPSVWEGDDFVSRCQDVGKVAPSPPGPLPGATLYTTWVPAPPILQASVVIESS